MVVDTSAITAILLQEPDRHARAIDAAPVRLVSAGTRVELACVVESRTGEAGRVDLEGLRRDGAFEVVAGPPEPAAHPSDAQRRFGRGRHPAALNIGDCISYALAAVTGHALLFEGEDLERMDVASRMQSLHRTHDQ
jgi:ribonuclease VapC